MFGSRSYTINGRISWPTIMHKDVVMFADIASLPSLLDTGEIFARSACKCVDAPFCVPSLSASLRPVS